MTAHFVPNDDVLEQFAAAANVSVSDVELYYLHRRTHPRVEAVAPHFPRRRMRVENYVPVDWDYGTNSPADLRYLGEKVIEKPRTPPPRQGFLGDTSSPRDRRVSVPDPDDPPHGRWVTDRDIEEARRPRVREPSLFDLARATLPRG